MKIACLQFNPIQENTYVVWDDTLEAVVIDAGNSNPREDAALDNFIAEHGLRPVLAANTHGHFDHTLGVAHLKKRYGIPFAMSLKDAFLLDNASTSGSIFGVPVGEMPSVDTDLDTTPEIRFGHTVLRVLRPAIRPAMSRSTNRSPNRSSRATRSSASRSGAPTCLEATIRGSCARSSTSCSRWATRCTSTPATGLSRPSATKCSTTPSSSKC